MQSKLTKRQKTIAVPRFYKEDGEEFRITATIRYDDECGNGHNTFSITGSIDIKRTSGSWKDYSGGCIHEDIAKHFPELQKYIKWHLVSSDGPLHYISNTTYHASNRDYNNLLAGEKRQLKNGKTGLPAWRLVAFNTSTHEEIDINEIEKYIDAQEQPFSPYTLKYAPWCLIGEGKERDFDAARSSAVWPEATDEQLSLSKDELTALLNARLPALMQEFKKAMEEIGFTF